VAIGVVAATVAVGFALLPSDARLYWGGYMFDASRVGTLPDSSNQSLQGAVARLMGTLSVNWQSIAAAGVVAAIGLAVAVRASRRGDEITGFSMCAIAGLLACPISWTHHWVLAVPALFLFAVRAYEERSRLMLIATGTVAAIGYSYAPERVIHLSLSPWSLASLPAADAYVLVGVSTIALGAWREISTCALARRMQTISTASGDGSFSTSLRGTPEPAFDIGKTPSGHTHAS
jgi:alpha-1,2-mannosyltransferase